MPGNEVADKVHNFFEQDNFSQGQDKSQVAVGNWQGINNNLWVGNQRQIGRQLSSNPKSYNVQKSDSERGDGRQSLQVPLGTSLTQLTSRAEFAKSQSWSQQLNSNGFMHDRQGFQTRQNHTEFDFLGEDTVSNRHNLTSGSVPILEPQEGSGIENRSVPTRNSGSLGTFEAPTDNDFLVRQPQIAQQLKMTQAHPTQQSGFKNMPQWQQDLMFKHLQELQRQRQNEEYQEAKQNQMNQLSATARQTTSDQLPSLVNGMPIHVGTNYFMPSEHMGGDRVPSTSQMYMNPNMNWAHRGGSPAPQGSANGLMVSHDQGRAFRSMGLAPQQFDQSLYGAPVATTRGGSNLYPHIQGISYDSAGIVNKTGRNQVEKSILQSPDFNNSFQGNQAAVFQDQEFHGRQEHGDWSGNQEEKGVTQAGPSQGSVSLDPTEKRILFNTDDNLWDRSNIMGTGGFGNSSDTDYLNGFPSLQSGSWSALMQSAVAETSSSDTGLQAEWSGLSFQKTEPSCGDRPTSFNGSGKQQMNWADNNLQNATSLASRPIPLFNDTHLSPNGCKLQGVLHSGTQSSYQQSEGRQTEASHESIRRSPKEASQWLNQSLQRNPLAEGFHHQIHQSKVVDNASAGAWDGQDTQHSENSSHSANTELTQKMRAAWAHEKSMLSYNIGGATSNTQNGWNSNDSLSQSGDAALKIRENMNNLQLSQRNDEKRHMHRESFHDIGMWKADNQMANSFPNSMGVLEQVKFGRGNLSANREDCHMNKFNVLQHSSSARTNQETNQQIPNNHFGYGHHAVDSLTKYREDDNVGKVQHQFNRGHQIESSLNNSDHASGENCDQIEVSGESHKSNHSHHTATGRPLSQSFSSSAGESHALRGANQPSEGLVDQRVSASPNFYHHSMGISEVKANTTDTAKHVIHSEVPSEQDVGGSRSHDQGYFGHLKFIGDVRDYTRDTGKGQLPDFQGTAKGPSEIPSRGVIPGHESRSRSYDGSTGFLAPNKKAVHASQNMLELLHKVDQSREQITGNNFGSSDVNQLPEVPDPEASDVSANFQRNQFISSQGFGLRLGPPSQRLPVSNHAFSSQNSQQMVDDLKSNHLNSGAREKSQATSTSSDQALHHSHGMAQEGHWDNKPTSSGQTRSETSNILEKLSSSGQPYPRNDLPHQSLSSARGQMTASHSFDMHASRFRPTQDSNDRPKSDHSAHASFPGATSSIQPGQEHIVLEGAPASQSMRGASQQGAFPVPHNVWTNVSSRQYSATSLPQKVPSNVFHSKSSLDHSQEATTRATQNSDSQNITGGGTFPSEYGSCSVNNQRCAVREEQVEKESSWRQIPTQKGDPSAHAAAASHEQESVARYLADENSVAGSLAAHAHQHEVDKRRYGKDPALISQTDQVFLQTSAGHRDIEAFGRSLKPTHGLNQSYSLLHQVQAMKEVETDPHNSVAKRFKGADCGLDAQHAAAKAAHQLFCGYNMMARNAVNELNAAGRQTSFTTGDSKMPRFSLELKDQNKIESSQLGLLLSHSVPPENIDQNLTVVGPKRKFTTSEFLPWYEETILGSQRLQNISIAEHDWALAANRLIEKVEDEDVMIEDGQPLVQPRRRLMLTTQLMQQLLRPAPSAILSTDATSNYETVTYTVAKLALEDACSLISNSENDPHGPPEKKNKPCTRKTISKRVSDQISKVVESFIGRARKVEIDVLRLEKRASIVDIRVECQDIERFAVINRFAMFHGRGHGNGSDAAQRTYPQRYVTARSMPSITPEGVQCLSL